MRTDESGRFPAICVTTGDAAGIGPELVCRLCCDLPAAASVAVIADARVIRDAERMLGVRLPFLPLTNLCALRGPPGLYLFDRHNLDPASYETGRVSKVCGAAEADDLFFALDLCTAGKADGVLYGPLNKTAFCEAGYAASGSIPLIAGHLGVPAGEVGEINLVDGLWTVRVTSHIPLREVAAKLTVGSVEEKIVFLHRQMRRSGLREPRIAVAALNPHNGENGRFGREEIEVIAPAVERARERGIAASGPFAADALFPLAFAGRYDGVVTMYHDQGQIAMKTRGFDRIVTIPGGIPVAAATPAHGTAFDIAGKGRADAGAMRNAFLTLVSAWKNSNERLRQQKNIGGFQNGSKSCHDF